MHARVVLGVGKGVLFREVPSPYTHTKRCDINKMILSYLRPV